MSKVNRNIAIDLSNMDKNAAITALINSGLDFKEANKYWVENRPERGTGFKARFYAELEKGEMSVEDFKKFLEPESDNVKKNASNFDGVRKMANAIWAGKK